MAARAACAVAAGLLVATAAPQRGRSRPSSGLEGAVRLLYRELDGVRLHLFAFRPEGWRPSDRRPAVVFFFGGGWVSGSPAQFVPQARYLASRGLVAACAEYRVRRRHGTTPYDAVEDAQAALAWLAAHAGEQGLDPRRIAAAGGSAGGHLAACTALAPWRPRDVAEARPAALLLCNPVLDTGPEGFGRGRVGERGLEISPLHHVRRGAPPALVLHGAADRTVPFAQAEAFRAAMAAVDARCDLVAYPGRGHGFFNPRRGARDFVTTTRAMDRFLASLGWLAGEPTLAEPGTTAWHGYTRHDATVAGCRLVVVEPEFAAPGRPWIWRARFFGHQPQVDLELLRRGWHLVYCDVAGLYGNERALRAWDAAYEEVTGRYRLAPKAALEAMSRGALVAYRWAARHPERVACVYADNPVCDIRSWPGGRGEGAGSASAWRECLAALGLSPAQALEWDGNPIDRLEPLARAGVPLLHVCGAQDRVVPVAENTAVLAERYRALGGTIDVIVVPGRGHHPHALAEPKPIVDFVRRHVCEASDFSTLRGGLARSLARLRARGRGTVAFLGGSITHNPGWRDLVADDLRRRLPGVELRTVNAGIPSFGSTAGAFRVRADVLRHGPIDLLFVEAAVNDAAIGRSPAEMRRGMEGIVRAVRRESPWTDVVMLHFVDPAKMERIRRGEVPPAIAAHEAVAERYGVPSIDLAAEVTWRIARGEFTWEEDFEDLHPAPFGQRLYAAAVARLLDRAWAEDVRAPDRPHALPSPLDPHCYQHGALLGPEAAGELDGFALDPRWRPADGAATRKGFVSVPVLVATRPGAACALRFRGVACGVLVNAGPDAGVLAWSVDGGPWRTLDLHTRWSHRLHLPCNHVLAHALPPGEHVLRLRVAERPAGTPGGSAVRIVRFLVDGAR